MRAEARVVITNPTGLHARPAVKLAQIAAGFDADVEIRADETGEWVRARSTARVMKLKAGARSVIHLRAEGAQADAALSALVDFVRRDFDEDPAAAPPAAGLPSDDAREDTAEGAGGSGAAVEETPGGRTISAVVASPGLAIGVLHVPAKSGGPARDVGGMTSDADGLASNVGGLVSDTGGMTPDAGGLARESGDPARESGGSALEAGGSALEAGGMTPDAGGLARESGDPARESGGSTRESSGSTRESSGSTLEAGGSALEAGGMTPDAGGLARESGDPARESGGSTRDSGGSALEAGSMTPDAGGLASDTGGTAQGSDGLARNTGGPETERAALDEAVARSLAELRGLTHGSGELAAGVIGFQIGLLEDEEFLEPVRAGIEAGMAAGQAWTRHLAGEIADYESAPTGYLRERAADLRDLRDRVVAAFGGGMSCGGRPEHGPSGDGLPGHDPSGDGLPGHDPSGDGLPGHDPSGDGLPGHDQPEHGPSGHGLPDHSSSGPRPPSHDLPDHCVVIADELTPSRFLEIDWSRAVGAATYSGSPASHVAMLARAQGVPMLVQLSSDPGELIEGTEAILDAERGCLVPAPPPSIRERYARRIDEQRARKRAVLRHVSRPARIRDGSPVRVLVNVDAPSCLDSLDPSHCDGIGLTRTEFLFHGAETLPGEDAQLRFYRRLAAWACGRPVTVRTLDAGGDKPLPGLTPEGESNPFLGLRGVRLSLARPEVLATQLRALARAAAGGGLRVMLPMVTTPDELHEVRRRLAAEVEALRVAGIEAAAPRLGMMVEVPAAALTIETFDADFFSIGTNDLTQYVLAAGRDSTAVADLLDPLHPAVLELIARVAGHGARSGREVSVCGEMAARPEGLRALLDAGIRTFSVPPAALASTKAALAAL